MLILHDSASLSPTYLPPKLLLPPPPKRLALPAPREIAPKIAGYLPAPHSFRPIRRVVEAEIVNPIRLIDRRTNPEAWWAEFERMAGRVRSIEEMNDEIEAKCPGFKAMYVRGAK